MGTQSKSTFLSIALFILSLYSLSALAVTETKKLTWAGCGISKNAFMSEMAAAYQEKTGVVIDFKGGGATKGIRQVASREVDIGGTCRQIIDGRNEMPVPQERRVKLTPVAWDALTVVVHKDNPVNDISMAQVRALYTGQIANWKQLGGRDAPIDLYVRKGKISGVGRTLREIVFADYQQDFVTDHIVDSSGPLERAIVADPNGIGITGVSSARKLQAKMLRLDGKDASYANIKNGDYLLYRPIYMVTHLQDHNPEIQKFIDFVMGPDGKKIMRQVGTVPYEDAISLWLKYIEQQNKAMARALTQAHVTK